MNEDGERLTGELRRQYKWVTKRAMVAAREFLKDCVSEMSDETARKVAHDFVMDAIAQEFVMDAMLMLGPDVNFGRAQAVLEELIPIVWKLIHKKYVEGSQ